MKDKEKQIEAMAKILREECFYDLKEVSIETSERLATKLLEHYQPKLPENSVVLSGEQCAEIVQDNYNIGYERGSKETAEKIFKELRNKCMLHIECDWCDYLEIELDDFNQVAKQFGVEIKE